MGFWTNKEDRAAFDDAEDLAYPPGRRPRGRQACSLQINKI
jgi:hypothetical protein